MQSIKAISNKTTLVPLQTKDRSNTSNPFTCLIVAPLFRAILSITLVQEVSRLMLHAFRLSTLLHPLTLEQLSFTALSDTFETELRKQRKWMIAYPFFYIKQDQKALLLSFQIIWRFLKYSRVRTSCAVWHFVVVP